MVSVNHLEDVTVGIAEKEPLERGFADGVDQFRAVLGQALLQSSKAVRRILDREVAPKLPLKPGWLKIRHAK